VYADNLKYKIDPDNFTLILPRQKDSNTSHGAIICSNIRSIFTSNCLNTVSSMIYSGWHSALNEIEFVIEIWIEFNIYVPHKHNMQYIDVSKNTNVPIDRALYKKILMRHISG